MTTNKPMTSSAERVLGGADMLNPFNATEKEDFNNVASPEGVGSGNPAPLKDTTSRRKP